MTFKFPTHLSEVWERKVITREAIERNVYPKKLIFNSIRKKKFRLWIHNTKTFRKKNTPGRVNKIPGSSSEQQVEIKASCHTESGADLAQTRSEVLTDRTFLLTKPLFKNNVYWIHCPTNSEEHIQLCDWAKHSSRENIQSSHNKFLRVSPMLNPIQQTYVANNNNNG